VPSDDNNIIRFLARGKIIFSALDKQHTNKNQDKNGDKKAKMKLKRDFKQNVSHIITAYGYYW
jgi:hypothetical protein